MGAVPVYIVDGPMSVLPDGSGSDHQKTSKGKSKRLPTPKSRGLGKAGGVAGAALSAAYLVPTLLSDDASTADKVTATAETVGGGAGAWAGAAAGAALGSFIPVVGTAIGGLIGGALGWAAGEWAGGKTADAINQSLDLNIKLEGAPGTKAEVTGMRSSTDNLNSNVYYGQGVRN